MRGVLLFFSALFMLSCNQSTFDSKEELLEYIRNPENDYYQEKSVNGIDFSLLYRPTDLMVSQEVSDKPTTQEVNSLREKYNEYLYFTLSMSANDKDLLRVMPKNRNEFGALVNTFSFNMREYVHLFTNTKDTIEMLDYTYPRMYGMSRSTTMLFVYPKGKKVINATHINLSIEDFGSNCGEVKFQMPYARLDNLTIKTLK